jgi:DUF971 family protein
MTPTEIILHQQSRELEIAFGDEARYRLPYEFLRVHSPSAEVRGHGPGQEILQVGKREVRILDVQPAGSYALKLVFDDGHDSGLYTWDYLHQLGEYQPVLWQEYLHLLEAAGESRDPADYPEIAPTGGGACGAEHTHH